ncbi:MAG: class I SAM-dependent methyltransferase [Selenomonadaceae bacterium]|nr:class I SAM-dependent methyltransferase [Selenomonadaceae bacterium]MBR1860116.1 class I SAM-dependent methyltransferase [Selenomonadaceae bacterium]
MMTNSGLFGHFAMKYLWQLSDEDYSKFLNQAFDGIPDNFNGRLLEIPIGTGVLSLPVYQNLPDADIISMDYSDKMLNAARNNAKNQRLNNITFLQGDVGNLPFDSEYFDIVLSINGFHVFTDKQAAYNETHRVLKYGGTFCGCMYVKGKNKWLDYFVKHFCERFNYFTPPYETIESLNELLCKIYSRVKITNIKSFAGFVCQK